MNKKTKKEPKIMFAIVSKDEYGQSIQLFKTKEQVKMFLKELKKINKNHE